MTKKHNLFVVGYFILFVVFIFPLFSTHASTSGLITCGLEPFLNPDTAKSEIALCSVCDLISLAQNLLNKALTYFAAPLAALMLGYGGFLMVIAGIRGGNPQAFTQGKKVLTNAIIGIVILFCSWLMIDTLLKSIGAYDYASGKKFGPWNVIECESPAISLPTHKGCKNYECVDDLPGFSVVDGCSEDVNCAEEPQHLACDKDTFMCGYTDGPGVNTCEYGEDPKCEISHNECKGENSCVKVAGAGESVCKLGQDAQCGIILSVGEILFGADDVAFNKTLANQLSSVVAFDTDADCDNKSAHTNLEELQNGQPITVCHNTCKSDKKPCDKKIKTVDPNMLNDLQRLTAKDLQYRVTSVATGKHKPDSDHYNGKGVDLKAINGTLYTQIETEIYKDSKVKFVQCENIDGDKIPCSSSPKNITHLHVSYR